MSGSAPQVHPELRPIAAMLPRFSFTAGNLWLFRLLEGLPLRQRHPKDIRIENVPIPGQDGTSKVRVRVYRPRGVSSQAPALLWLHGGGYIIGTPEQEDSTCIDYARQLGIVAASVAYRRAPEHPFPAGLEDGYSALRWLASQAGQLGIDAEHLAVGGASAGAGLAAALVQLAHDRSEVRPRVQLLIYPMLDDRTCARTDTSPDRLIWTLDSNRFGWESYLGRRAGSAEAPSYSSPARREDLSGLPPAWIGVGTLDLFHDEDVEYGRRLKASGVECEMHVVPGAFHGFDVVGPRLRVVRDFRQSQVAALARHLA
jgi:acetyl esterase/lipase